MSGKALVTGGAGFIGSHLVDSLLEDGWTVHVVDNFNGTGGSRNVDAHLNHPNYKLLEVDILELDQLFSSTMEGDYNVLVHLAARAGVRPSILNPTIYQQVNVCGTQNVLELARRLGVKQFVFTSSSSVYGTNSNMPWQESDLALCPISPYASSKISGELLGRVYSHLYGLRFIALRLFTVYGPRQRPDLAIYKFTRQMMNMKPIQIYGDGSTARDYTYVDDVVRGIRAAMNYDKSLYEIINLGSHRMVRLDDVVKELEDALGVKTKIELQQAQPGDVFQTCADISKAASLLGYRPTTDFSVGLRRFLRWFERDLSE